MVEGHPGMAVGATIGGLGGAVGGYTMGGSSAQGGNQALQTGKTNSQTMLENQLRLQASGSHPQEHNLTKRFRFNERPSISDY